MGRHTFSGLEKRPSAAAPVCLMLSCGARPARFATVRASRALATHSHVFSSPNWPWHCASFKRTHRYLRMAHSHVAQALQDVPSEEATLVSSFKQTATTADTSDKDIPHSSSRSASNNHSTPSSSGRHTGFCIINFYHLTDVKHPFKTLRAHQKWMCGKDIQGRIYLSSQGINAQCSGLREDAEAYAQWVSQQPGFEGLQWLAEECEGHLFPKLRLKIRPNLVQLAGGTKNLPITDPLARATPLNPTEWQEMLRTAVRPARLDAKSDDSASVAGNGAAATDGSEPVAKEVVVLDVRNAYEWDAGHFEGAARPLEEHFNQTPTDASGEAELPQYLQNVNRDTPVMMYCTGGIRCDIYSTYLRKKGFKNLYTLEKGIQNYLRQKGSDMWKGSLFVFDGRMAVALGDQAAAGELPAAAPCQSCGEKPELPHENCANIDCNKLYLACTGCKERLKGCCCEACIDAPRLIRKPSSGGQYGTWTQCATDDLLDELGDFDQEARQEATRPRQAALEKRIAEGRGEGRMRRRLNWRERTAERARLAREQQEHRRKIIQEALQAQKQREAAQPQGADAGRLQRLERLRQRRLQRQQLAEAA